MTSSKVQLHFGRFVHPIYREQLHATPTGWSYALTHPALTDTRTPTKLVVERSERLASAHAVAERVAILLLSEVGYVHRVRARALPDASLIHSCERLIHRSPLPYVLDLEHAALFTIYQRAALERPWARAVLERALLDERLRFLLPWSDAARRSVLAALSTQARIGVEPKLRTVMPSIRLAATRPRERRGTALRVLFVGTSFLAKGGVEAVGALRESRKTHDITLDMVTYAPTDWAARLEAEPGLTLHQPAGADFVQKLYSQADVLLFPSHMDTFGYVVMEAMAHGLPVIAPNHLALAETVIDGVSGLLYQPENMLWRDDTSCRFRHILPVPASYLRALAHPSDSHVRAIAERLTRLADNAGVYEELAQGAFDSVRDGHLSTGRRQAELAEIYDAAAAH